MDVYFIACENETNEDAEGPIQGLSYHSECRVRESARQAGESGSLVAEIWHADNRVVHLNRKDGNWIIVAGGDNKIRRISWKDWLLSRWQLTGMSEVYISLAGKSSKTGMTVSSSITWTFMLLLPPTCNWIRSLTPGRIRNCVLLNCCWLPVSSRRRETWPIA